MANYAIIKQKVDDIISNVSALAASGSRIRYYIFVFNPSISDKAIEVYRGSNADNATLEKPQDWYYGERMGEKFAEQLNTVVSNPSNVKVAVTIKDGSNNVKGQYNITLQEQYENFRMQDPDSAVVPQQQQQPQQQNSLQGLGSLNELLGMAFGGLSGTQEGSGLGAILGVRDQLLRNHYDREVDSIRQDYERKQNEREIDELRKERDNYRKKVEELNRECDDLKREFDNQTRELEDAEERIEELEKMKPEASVAGVALTGIASQVAETLLLRHSGTIGKLFNVDKDAMLGMLTDDLKKKPEEQPQQAVPTMDAPIVVSEGTDGTNEPQDERVKRMQSLFNSLSEDEQSDFWTIVLYLDENRNMMHEVAIGIEKQQQKQQQQPIDEEA